MICINEISAGFAAFVRMTEKIHLFDPIPLYNKYSQLQIDKNPLLSNMTVINEVGVSNFSKKSTGSIKDITTISPRENVAVMIFHLSVLMTMYGNALLRLDYKKLGIEGAEFDTLISATEFIRNSN